MNTSSLSRFQTMMTTLVIFSVMLTLPVSALQFADVKTTAEIAALTPLSFRGEVIDVRYELASDSAADLTVPYTVYTYLVEKGYRGAYSGDIVTLFQYGGPIDKERWEGIVGLPTYEVGEKVAVFHDDDAQFLFIGLYASAGIRRFVEVDGEMVTLSAGWTALSTNAEQAGLTIEDHHTCMSTVAQPALCAGWIDGHGESQPGPFPAALEATHLSMTEFDQMVEQWVRAGTGTESTPAQTLNEASFANKLVLFMAAQSQPQPLDVDTVTTLPR